MFQTIIVSPNTFRRSEENYIAVPVRDSLAMQRRSAQTSKLFILLKWNATSIWCREAKRAGASQLAISGSQICLTK